MYFLDYNIFKVTTVAFLKKPKFLVIVSHILK